MIKPFRALGIVLALGLPIAAFAADHLDSPTAASTREPTADITDVYAWMTSDATKLNLVAAVNADAGRNATFSDAVVYQFAVSSSASFGAPQESTLIPCKFIDGTNVECWAGDDYVVGDPTNPEGIVSDNGGLRVFAGLRDDPFFLEYNGFLNAVNLANSAVAAGAVQFEEANKGCPTLTAEQQTALVGALQSGNDGAPPSNTFAGQNVLALVIQVDKAIVDGNGPVLGVSFSTYTSN
jgi:Domain of unknown function (DUF4331)